MRDHQSQLPASPSPCPSPGATTARAPGFYLPPLSSLGLQQLEPQAMLEPDSRAGTSGHNGGGRGSEDLHPIISPGD
jgi:hypothetical protein